MPFDQVAGAGVAADRTRSRRRSGRPTTWPPTSCAATSAEAAHHLLNLSFAQFRADRDIVALERQLERSREQLERAPPDGALRAGRRRRVPPPGRRPRRRARTAAAAGASDEALEPLPPGRRAGAGRPRRPGRRPRPRVAAARRAPAARRSTTSRQLVRLGRRRLPGAARRRRPRRAPRAVRAAQPGVPRGPRPMRCGRCGSTQPGRRRRRRRRARPSSSRAVAEHPVAQDPQRDARLRAAASAERLDRDVDRLERRIRGRSESLARQFDRVLRVLESWGYVDGWALTAGGRAAGPALHRDRPAASPRRCATGVLDGLDAAELAALVSCFTYERRGPDGDGADARRRAGPAATVARARWRTLERLWRDARTTTRTTPGSPRPGRPTPGSPRYVHDWAAGDELADVLDDDEITGGDFVRNVKQVHRPAPPARRRRTRRRRPRPRPASRRRRLLPRRRRRLERGRR